MMTSVYATTTPLATRQQQCERIAAKHGERMVPIVLEAVGKNAKVNLTALPASATVAELQAAVRQVGDVSTRSAKTVVVAGCTPSANTTLADLYAACRNEDGFLYVNYAGESTMGCGIAVDKSSGGSSAPSTPSDTTYTPSTEVIPNPYEGIDIRK